MKRTSKQRLSRAIRSAQGAVTLLCALAALAAIGAQAIPGGTETQSGGAKGSPTQLMTPAHGRG